MKCARRKGVIYMEFSNSDSTINKNGQKPTGAVNTRSLSFSGTKPTSTVAAAKPNSSPAERTGHKLELDHERAMSMTGVKDVPVFTDKNITDRLENETLLVTGQNLAVKTLDIENGKLQVTGRVFSLRYTSQAAPTSIIKRIFK